MSYTGCKHLDYEEGKYENCTLVVISEESGWKHWRRDKPPYRDAPVNVQFCKQRGRINDIFSCINPGERNCFVAQDGEKA